MNSKSNALARVEGTARNADDANARFAIAKEHYHLISPATSVGLLPEGCGVAMSAITVDIERDTYDVGGARGLSKTALQKIGAALGVTWDPYASRRMDDGSDPYYVHWRAVGQYRAFDGQIQTVTAAKEMDLRDGSPQLLSLWERFRSAEKAYRPGGDKRPPKSPEAQIREMRLHIQAHAETKAQLRAIRSLGIRTSYTKQELLKPFVAARVMFTGQTDDPALRKMFAEKTADSFLGGTRALYGTHAEPQSQALQSGSVSAPRLAPPPVGSVREDDSSEWPVHDTQGETVQQEKREPQQQQQKSQDKPAQTSQDAQTGANPELVLKFSKSKGRTIAQADTSDLEWIADTVHANLETGESRYPESDKKLLAAVNAELAKREAEHRSENY